jgi:radical SAM superfamily enzyme YgiQ (UPF0313 family)
MKLAQVVTNSTYDISPVRRGSRRALLVSPPVYDTQYWARWSQPAGLLRLASLLKKNRYHVDLIDCMETDKEGFVPKTRRYINGQPYSVARDNIKRDIWHYGLSWEGFEQRLRQLEQPPHEVWISSIMTYWWETTRDAITYIRKVFPKTTIVVGGIYPTLAPEHAREKLGADIIFKGEMFGASNQWTDFSLYQTAPTYGILTTTRGCPWECYYCAARALNDGSNKMRQREPEEVLEEIEYKMKHFGVRHFGFYEDNALALRGHLQKILELIIERGHKLKLYAPEGFETRMLNEDLLRLMKQAGFAKVHLPFETLKWETNVGWNRRHASTASFDNALQAAIRAGFRPRSEEINAFVLFGLPDDKLEDIMDSLLYVHHEVGSIIPMLFSPVPGTQIYKDYEHYLLNEMGWDFQDLNGKFLPFLESNKKRYPKIRASDYLELEKLMYVLNNGKVMARSINLCDDSPASIGFRRAVKNVLPKSYQRELSSSK